jgi:hypothetical protein
LPAFEISRDGLERILSTRGVEAAVLELIQNAIDEDSATVSVRVERGSIKGRSNTLALITVVDDSPKGFADLSHAYTMFAESKKKGDPEKRGRFNLGEKLVIARCKTAILRTTTGSITWSGDTRQHSNIATDRGSIFIGEIPMTTDEIAKCVEAARSVIVEPWISYTVNGVVVPQRVRVATGFGITLPTVHADSDGFLRPTKRQTEIALYRIPTGRKAWLFELGIPVVEIDCGFDVDVRQKIPLNMDRDNVTPAYLAEIQRHALNLGIEAVEDRAGTWIDSAIATGKVDADVLETVVTARFGLRRVMRDPSDPEAAKIAHSQGFTVVEPRSLSREMHVAIRAAELIPPAGKVTPSQPKSSLTTTIDPTPSMQRFATWVRSVAYVAIGPGIVDVDFIDSPRASNLATYYNGRITFNAGRLGSAFFEGRTVAQLDLVIHELAHFYSADHLSSAYYDGLSLIGARLAVGAAKRFDFALDL